MAVVNPRVPEERKPVANGHRKRQTCF